MTNNIVKKLSTNMGLEDPTLIEKASEYTRMLQMKNNFGNINETFKAAICLDLAATQLGIGFDKNTAKGFANSSMAAYKNMYNTIEKILGLDRCITISELCVQLGIMSVNKTAEQLLNKYKELDSIDKDFEHPQYVSAAVYTACQLKQVKINKTQFLNISRLKPKQWKELETEFLKFAENNGMKTDMKMKNSKKKGNQLTDMLEDLTKDEDIVTTKKQPVEEMDTVESYECWKERILDEAYKALKKTRKT